MSTKITVTSAWSRARTPEEDRLSKEPRDAELRSCPSTSRSTVCAADFTRAEDRTCNGGGASKLTRALFAREPPVFRERRSKTLATSEPLASASLCCLPRLSIDDTDAFASEPIDTDPVCRLSPLCALCVSSSALPGPRAPRLRDPHSCEKDTTLEAVSYTHLTLPTKRIV